MIARFGFLRFEENLNYKISQEPKALNLFYLNFFRWKKNNNEKKIL